MALPDVQKKILIVEDDKYIRDLYFEILSGEGFSVDTAEDGEIGYKKIYQGGYDLVLLDIRLPKMDGLMILQKIHSETPPLHKNNCIIVLSNIGQETVIAKAITLGAKGYMVKADYTTAEVVNKVKGFLNL